MNRALIFRAMRDSWMLLASCCALTMGFIWLRVWIASKIPGEAFIKLFSESLKIFRNLLPVPIEELASALGRSAFSYEEMPVILLLGLWTVTRGSECLAGRIGSGTMEMLLAQPVRRATVVSSHSVVTLLGVAALGLASWLGMGAGLATSQFKSPPELSKLAPGLVNYLGLGVFLLGLATLTSALARTRSQAVAAVMAFYVIELALTIVSRLSPSAEWLGALTILSAYEPTRLTLGIANNPAATWPQFWELNSWLFGLGVGLWTTATVIFCRRDVPAPL